MAAAYSTGGRTGGGAEGGSAVRRAMQDPARRAELRARLLERKTADFLFEQAKVTEGYNLITPA
jgi:hypothetical protein